jgi:hypothetical protein
MNQVGTWTLALSLVWLSAASVHAQDAWIGTPEGAGTHLLASSRQVLDARVDQVDLADGGRVVAAEFVNCRDVVMAQELGTITRFAASGTMTVLASKTLGGYPRDLAVSAEGVLVAHSTGSVNMVSLLAAGTLEPLGSWSIPGVIRHVAAGAEGELGLAFWSASAYGSRADSVSVLDLANRTLLGSVSARDLGQAAQRHPGGLGLSDFQMAELTPDGEQLIVMSGETLHRLALRLPTTGAASAVASASSSYNSNYGAANLTDGNQNSYWIGGVGATPWIVTVDLGSPQALSALDLSWYSSSYYQASNMDVLVSSDGTSYSAVATNLTGQAAAQLDLNGAEARFVQLKINTLNGGSFPVIRELSVEAVDVRSAFDFLQSGPRIGQNPQRIEVSADGGYVALPSGGGNYRVADHPELGGYGLYVYPADNLLSPALAFTNGAYPRALGFDVAARRLYSSDFDQQLLVFDAQGQRIQAYPLTRRGDQVVRQLVAPQGHQVFVLSDYGRSLLRVSVPQ